MKNFFSRFSKDRALITAMCACIILVTAAALITMYNKNNQSDDGEGIVSEQQTEKSTEEAEEVAEVTTETETKNLTVKIETEPELATVSEEIESESAGDMALASLETEAETLEGAEIEVDASVETEGDSTDTEIGANLSDIETEANVEAGDAAVSADDALAETETDAVDSSGFVMNFTSESTLVWPVEGEVLREFSMDTTVWFSTLKQYKTSDAIQIQSAAGTEVVAAANGQVVAVGEDDELGSFVVMDLGNGYRVTYAQLSDIIVNPGNYVTAGTAFACVAEPTYYYVVDGDHLYFKLTCDDELLDPLDYLE